jgi:hypothetical protein
MIVSKPLMNQKKIFKNLDSFASEIKVILGNLSA